MHCLIPNIILHSEFMLLFFFHNTTWPISPLHIISFTRTSVPCVDVHGECAGPDTASWTSTMKWMRRRLVLLESFKHPENNLLLNVCNRVVCARGAKIDVRVELICLLCVRLVVWNWFVLNVYFFFIIKNICCQGLHYSADICLLQIIVVNVWF